MQISELESKGLKKSFKIVVGADEIESQRVSELERIGKTAKVAGFRTGKIPMKILNQMYGRSVLSDVLDNLIKKSVSDLLKEKNLRPALTPDVKLEEYKEGGELAFSVSLEVFPDLPEQLDFSGIELERKVFEVTEKDIDEAAKRVAERNPDFVELPEGSVAAQDNIVKIDFKGSIDGEEFAGGTAEGFQLKLGSGQFIEGFEDQLIGAKSGEEKLVKVTFPAKYPAAHLAGKDAEFVVNVKSVLEAKIPEINEEFAKRIGIEDLAKLRELISIRISSDLEHIVRTQLKKPLFDALEKKFQLVVF